MTDTAPSDGASAPKSTLSIAGGVLCGAGAAVASCGAACGVACAPPILAALGLGAGAGGVIETLSTLRPVLLGIAAVALGLGFWRAYRPGGRRRPARWPLWLAAVLVLGVNLGAVWWSSGPQQPCTEICPTRPPGGGPSPCEQRAQPS